MKLAIVYSGLHRLGGIQTLIVRLAEHLASVGIPVALVLDERFREAVPEDPGLMERARASAEILYVRQPFSLSPSGLPELAEFAPTHLLACDGETLLVALVLQARQCPEARVLAGVYHPMEFCFGPRDARRSMRTMRRAFLALPDENIVFLNEACRASHGRSLGRGFEGSPIVPIPVDMRSVDRRPERGRIVSVGRLTEFKTYNWHLPAAIAELQREGMDVRWDVYGDGPMRGRVEEAVRESGAKGVVLHGAVPYAEFVGALQSAWEFVGMGTAYVEAAACGVPSLQAVERLDAPQTYGWLHELNDATIGEYVPGREQRPMADELRRVLALSQGEYTEWCRASRDSALRFSLENVAGSFLAALEGAKPARFEIGRAECTLDAADRVLWRLRLKLGATDPWPTRYNTPI